MSLNSLLEQLSRESTDGSAAAVGAEEITVVTEDTVSEVEEHLAELAEEIEKMGDTQADADKVADAVETLESKLVMLAGIQKRGEFLSSQASIILMRGVTSAFESRGFPESFFKQQADEVSVELESDKYDYSPEVTDALKAGYEKTKALLAKVLAMFKTIFSRVVEKAIAIAGTIEVMSKNLAKRKEAISGKTYDATYKVSKKFPNLVVADGKVNPIKQLKDVTAAIAAQKAIVSDAISNPAEAAKNNGGLKITDVHTAVDDGSGSISAKFDEKTSPDDLPALTVAEIAQIAEALAEVASTLKQLNNVNTAMASEINAATVKLNKKLEKDDSNKEGDTSTITLMKNNLKAAAGTYGELVRVATAISKEAYVYATISANSFKG